GLRLLPFLVLPELPAGDAHDGDHGNRDEDVAVLAPDGRRLLAANLLVDLAENIGHNASEMLAALPGSTFAGRLRAGSISPRPRICAGRMSGSQPGAQRAPTA